MMILARALFVPLEDLDRETEQLLRRQVVAGDLHGNVAAVRGGRNVEQEQEVYRARFVRRRQWLRAGGHRRGRTRPSR